MTKHNILFIGLDTHKEFVEVAYIEDIREYPLNMNELELMHRVKHRVWHNHRRR